MSSRSFLDYAKYYDLLYGDKDYRGEAEYFAGLVRRYESVDTHALLELGAGTGRHQEHFRRLGFSVKGIELSEEMVAQSSAYGSDISQGDMRSFRSHERFGAVLALFHVMSYMTTTKDLASAFSTARSHLDTGGLFVFDFWFDEAVTFQRPEPRIKRVVGKSAEVIRFANPISHPHEKIVEVNYTVFGRPIEDSCWEMNEETHVMRYLSLEEVQSLSRETGFELISCEETLSGLKPSTASWGVTAVLRAT